MTPRCWDEKCIYANLGFVMQMDDQKIQATVLATVASVLAM